MVGRQLCSSIQATKRAEPRRPNNLKVVSRRRNRNLAKALSKRASPVALIRNRLAQRRGLKRANSRATIEPRDKPTKCSGRSGHHSSRSSATSRA
jgi:hypothetical protein